ncbi:ParA family protein [Actinoplanes sp. NPDC026619]|uniref:MinD/ParA family ATP-binding protein n=1 Tax=Actinoplanes sp. NPDC026619 TaxID=3155798 RepID=UPI0034046F8C
MTDEHPDRVYVPGAGNTPPDRDVEPFWAPEELEAPVHGGRPVPHETPPAVPIPGPGTGVYRPDRPMPAPPPAVPVPPPTVPPMGPVIYGQGIPAQRPPTQAWPNLEPAAGEPAPNEPPTMAQQAEPTSDPGVHGSPDSPWSQPPQQRPAPPEQPPAPPSRATATVPVPNVPRPETPPPPPQQQPAPAPAPENGQIYRPQPPQQPGPGPQQQQQPGPAPQYGPVPPPQQQRPPAPPPGPYPPTMQPPQQPQPGPAPAPGPGPADPFQDLGWISDGTPTAEEFARRRLAKPAEPVATMGPRAILRKGTAGLVKLAPSKREQEIKQDVEMVRRNFGGLRQVTIVNPKGGAGKTVAVLLLAMTFGQKRGGYVLAWDNNETQGTLGMRAQQDFHARTVRDMMRDLHLFRGSQGRVGDLSQYVRAQGEGMFDVMASDESATAGEMLTAGAFAEIREIVSRFYKLIFVDTGNNVRAQNWQAAIDATDQLVITMSARNDSAETAARMLDHLEQSGRQRLVRQAVSVVTMPPTRKDIDLPAIRNHFAARTRSVLMAPYEKLIDSGEPLRYGQLSSNTRDAWLKIAAAVAEGL